MCYVQICFAYYEKRNTGFQNLVTLEISTQSCVIYTNDSIHWSLFPGTGFSVYAHFKSDIVVI